MPIAAGIVPSRSLSPKSHPPQVRKGGYFMPVWGRSTDCERGPGVADPSRRSQFVGYLGPVRSLELRYSHLSEVRLPISSGISPAERDLVVAAQIESVDSTIHINGYAIPLAYGAFTEPIVAFLPVRTVGGVVNGFEGRSVLVRVDGPTSAAAEGFHILKPCLEGVVGRRAESLRCRGSRRALSEVNCVMVNGSIPVN